MGSPSDQIAIITGASSGIGRAIALRLADQGFILGLIGRTLTTLESLADLAEKTSPRVLAYQADLTKKIDVKLLSDKLKKDISHINALVHCAGVITIGNAKDSDVEDFDRQYYTNVRAPYVLTMDLLPLIERCKGQIVMMNSSIWQQARAGLSQYAATKYALKGFTDQP